jgi:murein DD-endopeptidase MepM/ murein hydrolase activator NlpD
VRSPSLPATAPNDEPVAKGKPFSARVRARTLAVAGGAVLVGAALLTLALAVRARSSAAPPVARGAALAGALCATEAFALDAGGEPVPDAAPDAAPPSPSVWRVSQLSTDADVRVVEGVLGHRPLLPALDAAGVSRSEAQRIVRSLAPVRDVDRFGPKDSFAVALDKMTGRVIAYEVATSPIDVWQAREQARPDDGTAPPLVARKLELVPEQVRVAKAVLVGSDLRASFAEAGLAPVDEMLALVDDALDGHAELSDIRPGARVRVVATQERVNGEVVGWTSLDAVEYFPVTPNAPPVRVYRFDSVGESTRGESGRVSAGKRHGWFDAKGRQPYRGGFRSPVPLARIASRFNPHRMHPVLHVVMPHNGVDFAAPMGAPVYATAAGVVSSVGPGGPCGNMVEIDHAGGVTSVYCHLSRYASGLRVGQHVESRQLIAYVGQTGRVTGPHLHFGIKKNGVFIDPMTLRLDGVRVVPRAQRDEFDRARAELDADLDAIALPAPTSAGGPPSGTSGAPEGSSRSGEDETFYEEP